MAAWALGMSAGTTNIATTSNSRRRKYRTFATIPNFRFRDIALLDRSPCSCPVGDAKYTFHLSLNGIIWRWFQVFSFQSAATLLKKLEDPVGSPADQITIASRSELFVRTTIFSLPSATGL
jgi:hypothetical protein